MAIRSFPLEIQLLRSRLEEQPLLPLKWATACLFAHILSVFFVIFVLSAAMEVVMFTNR
jgi:hypothetical protein